MKLVRTQVKDILADLAIERRRADVCICGHRRYAHGPLGGTCERCTCVEFWDTIE